MTNTDPTTIYQDERPRLHLSHVAIENVKGIKGVQVTIEDGALVVVAGPNGAGKSSFIDAIWYALVGQKAMKEAKNIVSAGEERGHVEVLLGEGEDTMLVTRTWTASGSTVTVKNSRGVPTSSPVDLLKSMVGPMALAPMEFVDLPGSKQVAMLVEALSLDIDLDELNERDAQLREERKLVGRERDTLAGSVKLLPEPPADLPTEPVSIDDLLAEQRAAQAANQERELIARRRTEAAMAQQAARDRLEALQRQVAEAEREVIQANEAAAAAANRVVPDEVDEDAIRDRIAAVSQTNELIAAGHQRTERVAELTAKATEYDDMTGLIDQVAATKAAALAAASLPYPGLVLSPDGDGLMLDGVALKDCSAAQQRLVACSLAMNPDAQIRLIRVEDGSLLDSTMLATLETMAAERDYQVLIEIVDEDPDAQGIVFRDGQLAPKTEAS